MNNLENAREIYPADLTHGIIKK